MTIKDRDYTIDHQSRKIAADNENKAGCLNKRA